jgi:4-hydroxy-3-methylbut-2-enyl diphosphate reductase
VTKILFDKDAGLCPGVKRTIIDALSLSKKERNVVSYGELIHNPNVVLRLSENGIDVVNKLSDIKADQFVIVRAHGIPLAEEEYLVDRGVRHSDLTCPRVKSVHKIILDYREKGFTIIIVGQPLHPETIGHLGYAGNNGIIVSSLEEASRIEIMGDCLLIAQTTISAELFSRISEILIARLPSLKIINTICSFTLLRQKWIDMYSKKAGYSVIIGGKKSSNTGKLYEIAKSHGEALWIEDPKEIEDLDLGNRELIAVTGGTSTPEEVLDEAARLFEKKGAQIIYT